MGKNGAAKDQVVEVVAGAADEDSGLYEVERIVQERVTKAGIKEYKIRWKTYDASNDTWEVEDNLAECPDVLTEWEDAKKSGGVPGKGVSKGTGKRKREADNITNKKTRSISPKVITTKNRVKMQFKIQGQGSPPTGCPAIDVSANHPERLAFLEKLKTLKGPSITIVNFVDEQPCPKLSKKFRFLNEYIYGENVPIPDETANWGCDCKGPFGCKLTGMGPENCSCLEENHVEPGKRKKFAFTSTKLLKHPGSHKNAYAIHECNALCTCGPRCANRVVGNGRKIPLELFKTVEKGWALRCPIKIKAGTYIDKYTGEVIDPEESERRNVQSHLKGLSYLFDLDKFTNVASEIYTVDGEECGGVARFINHSCDPNVAIYAVTRNRSQWGIYDLALFAEEDIEARTELTFAYKITSEDDDEDDEDFQEFDEQGNRKAWPCHCGAENCSGRLW